MSYLDTNKSIMISSPAGSGKTEKLARRYIALLQHGVDVERVLAVTFTDKAAAEMKQRILRILKNEDEKLFRSLLEKIPLMRVSTIHSFCGTLIRRFSFDADIDPNYSIADEMEAGLEWDEILYDVLMEVGAGFKPAPTGAYHATLLHDQENNFILQTLGEKGFRGLDYLKNTMDYLFHKRPFSLEAKPFIHTPSVTEGLTEELRSWETADNAIHNYKKIFLQGFSREIVSIEDLFLTSAGLPRQKTPSALKGIANYQEWALKMSLCWKNIRVEEFAERGKRIYTIFNACLRKYLARKKAKGVLDFSDLEYLAYKMLTENPEWANILYAFDEKTDHILVDEFQDTNNFQWGVINKLTEEWRSGMGAKRESGTRPTIFFVGDEKQSIYFFRGANVEIFHRAKEQMETWLGDEFLYVEAKENYRSRPAIVEFTNRVFSKIMQRPEKYPWITRYSPFTAHRTGIPNSGRIELVLLQEDEDAGMDEKKQKEADVIAQRIKSLAGNFEIADRATEQKRFCRYSDIAILLKNRTHLAPYEEALRNYSIPFVAVKGIGFYQENEISTLRALVFFLSNPHDDYSLYMLLKSPLFNMDESFILQLTGLEGESLFEKMLAVAGLKSAIPLQQWLSLLPKMPVAELIEHILVSTKAWRFFHEEQKRANIKKFIRIVEDLESKGKSLIKIRDFLERAVSENEAKANVNTEGMDAVKIMTIHAAKGLEFPVVIVPGIEEQFSSRAGDNLIYEREGSFFFKSVPEPCIRKQDDDFQMHEAREEEEQKRLFYVAVTRAEEALILTGHRDIRENSFLGFLSEGLGLQKQNDTFVVTDADVNGLAFLTEEDVRMLYEHARKEEAIHVDCRQVEVLPLPLPKRVPWKSVTETTDIRSRHGEDWLIIGDVLHRIFEGVSKGILKENDLLAKAASLLASKGITGEDLQRKNKVIENEITTLREKSVWQDIIMPREDSFAELPFILESGDSVYSGRIDRIIKCGDVYKIFDYKTFPVKEKEIKYLLSEYSFQMNMYKNAVKKLFSSKNVQSFIIFTNTGEIYEV